MLFCNSYYKIVINVHIILQNEVALIPEAFMFFKIRLIILEWM